MEAAHHGYADVMSVLLESGASMGTMDKKGFTAMTLASAEGHSAAVNVLLKAGTATACKLDAQNALGESALLLASHTGSVETTVALLEAGADLEKRNVSGMTALEIARNARHWPVVGVLLAYGAEIASASSAASVVPEAEVLKAAQALLSKAAKQPGTPWAKWAVTQGPRVVNPKSASAAKEAKAVLAILDAQSIQPEQVVAELRALSGLIEARQRGDAGALKAAIAAAGALQGGFSHGEFLSEVQQSLLTGKWDSHREPSPNPLL